MLNLAFFMMLQALNTESGAEYDLNGPIGQVYTMATTNDIMLFAGGQVITMLTFAFLKFSIIFDFVSGFDFLFFGINSFFFLIINFKCILLFEKQRRLILYKAIS
jgi:hypothetical protein